MGLTTSTRLIYENINALQPHRHSNHSALMNPGALAVPLTNGSLRSVWRTFKVSHLLLRTFESTTFLQHLDVPSDNRPTFFDSNRWFLLPQAQEDEEEHQRDEDLKGQDPLERKRRRRKLLSSCLPLSSRGSARGCHGNLGASTVLPDHQ